MRKWLKKSLLLIIIAICLISIVFSGYKIYLWHQDNKESSKLVNIINEKAIITESNLDSTIINNDEEISEDNPYWDYIKMNLINVDFNNLLEINENTAGWINVLGTNVNYPFVQTTDNDFYLTHSFDKSKNKAGWVFLDYRNSNTNLDKNTIIYAHNRKDQSMFGSLKNTLNKDWFNNKDNHVIKVSTQNNNTLWQIFSIYHIETTNDYININFTDEEFADFINLITSRSIYNFNTSVSSNDHILTLSTCHGSKEKLVIHAKLIKIEEKEKSLN